MIKRLSALTKKELLLLGDWMRGEIQPASISAGCTWVCQARQQPHFWGDKYLAELHADRERKLGVWIAFKGGDPVGTCWVCWGDPDRAITLFLIDTTLTPVEQVKTADELALRSIEDMLADSYPSKSGLIIAMRLDPQGEAYADLCEFSKVKTPSPLTPRRISFKALRENILARQKHG